MLLKWVGPLRLLAAFLTSTVFVTTGFGLSHGSSVAHAAKRSNAPQSARAGSGNPYAGKPRIVDDLESPESVQGVSSKHWQAKHDRVRLRCQGNKFILYIDRVRGIDSVNLFWPDSPKAQLVLHFKNFPMLERLALTTSVRTFDTSLRTLKEEQVNADCAKTPKAVFRLLQDRTNTKDGDIVVLVDSAITAGTADQKLQVSWIDAYR